MQQIEERICARVRSALARLFADLQVIKNVQQEIEICREKNRGDMS